MGRNICKGQEKWSILFQRNRWGSLILQRRLSVDLEFQSVKKFRSRKIPQHPNTDWNKAICLICWATPQGKECHSACQTLIERQVSFNHTTAMSTPRRGRVFILFTCPATFNMRILLISLPPAWKMMSSIWNQSRHLWSNLGRTSGWHTSTGGCAWQENAYSFVWWFWNGVGKLLWIATQVYIAQKQMFSVQTLFLSIYEKLLATLITLFRSLWGKL